MNGNISKEGITLDLEWMHRIGIRGYDLVDVTLGTPQVVPHRLAYMSPEWKDAFRYATELGHKLDLEEGVPGSPGWSETGGPWVLPSHAMKKYVWSETSIEGGRHFSGKLKAPPSIRGPFQDIPYHADSLADFYADTAVIACRVPPAVVSLEAQKPKIAASGGGVDLTLLSDGRYDKTTDLPAAPIGQKAWIQYEFARPQTIRAVTMRITGGGGYRGTGKGDSVRALESSDDGQLFRPVATIPYSPIGATISFPPVTARYFRVTFLSVPIPQIAVRSAFHETLPEVPKVHHIAELTLHPEPRVNRFELKAGFATAPDLYGFATPNVDSESVIPKQDVIDLTAQMGLDGKLDWDPPPGNWVVLRMGYSLTGMTNHPATPEATGLEVDKLSCPYVKDYIDKYLDNYGSFLHGLLGAIGLGSVYNDSWEAGAQDWTDDFIAEFRKRRGYDPVPWMPVLTGRVIESAQASDRFLWDFRKTIADLTADCHYGQLEESIHARGMVLYSESDEGGRALIADGMEVKKKVDVPMGAMWTQQQPGMNRELYNYDADDRESSSVAHIYGQNIAAAESLTGSNAPWAWSPATLKPTIDQEFLNGINRIVIHESAHQPLVGPHTAPGLTLGPYGQWFNRNETWAEQAGPWVDYMARSSFLLQQGRFAADIVYFYGEDSNLTALFSDKAPPIPPGYGFDYINADGLIHELTVVNGMIQTPSRMAYRVLGLDPYSRHMSLPVLRAIHKLVEDGASVAGSKPTDDPSLADDDAEFHRLADELFGDGSGVHRLGKGKVYAGESLAATLDALKLQPDFEYSKPKADTHLEFVHRILPQGDIYFVDNRSEHEQTVDVSLRVTGRLPELWYAETGQTQPVSYKMLDGRTTVPLHLEAWGTVFVVLRKSAPALEHTEPRETITELSTLEGPWEVSFPSGLGAPASISLDALRPWNESSDPGVKYFSGTGTYSKILQAPAQWFGRGERLWLDLGDVANLAEVTVNGKPLGIVWHAPFRLDVTDALKPGENVLTIKVTNAWVNRLIGDQQPGAIKYTFADVQPYKADSPLLASGLIGSVKLLSVKKVE